MKKTMMMIAIAPLSLAPMAHGQCAPDWHIGAMGDPGMTFAGGTGIVNRMVAFDDGTGTALYVSGIFDDASGTPALGVAKWDGESWSALGSGIAGRVTALGAFDDGTGMALYAGGNFLEAGGVAASGVAKWDGERWSPLGEGIVGTTGRAAAFVMTTWDDGSGPALYVGGSFGFAGGQPASNIAKWDGAQWHNIGDAEGGTVNTLLVWDDGSGEALYVGGNLSFAGGGAANRLAKYDGSEWSAVGEGGLLGGEFDGRVNALAVYDDGSGEKLYVGGNFLFAGGLAADSIATWDGTDWAVPAAGGVTGGNATAMAVYNDGLSGRGLYVSGSFTTAGGAPKNQIARFDSTGWSDVGEGIFNPSFPTATSLLVHDDGSGVGPALYVGGGYMAAGGLTAGSIARWGGCVDSCYADCDGDGELTFFDFLCFQDAFATASPYADCDGDGVLDFFDFLCFQNEFAAGCP